jgi:hypothetical protein
VSKVRARDRVKTPQTKPLWARDPHHYSASGFSDESYGTYELITSTGSSFVC